jgi:ATP:ADP antiporter, AAA family
MRATPDCRQGSPHFVSLSTIRRHARAATVPAKPRAPRSARKSARLLVRIRRRTARRPSCYLADAMRPDTERRGIDRVLNLFTEVRPGEATTALLLALNVFLILMAYYVLKPVREALILGEGSAELKSYLSAGQVAVLAFVVPLYGRLVARYPRMRLINLVTLFFTACPVIFYVLAMFGVPLAVVFFVWIGVFSMMIVAQFWSFANDVYTKEEGERLFVIVGFGASLGAVAGARVADRLIELTGIYQLMLLGAAILAGQLWLTNQINAREAGRARSASRDAAVKTGAASSGHSFALVFRTRYLLLIAMMLMLVNWVNTTGEYILGSIVKDTAVSLVAEGRNGGLTEEQLIGDFYSKYFTAVNVLGLLLQLFVVSRVVKYLGMGWAVMVLPILSFGAYNILAFVPTLWAVLAAKVAENSTDYSLNNTVRNMLFLPCTYEQKFSAKQAIDSFFVRMGDVLSALLVFAGTTVFVLQPRGFAAINAVLVVIWLLIAWRVGRHYQALAQAGVPPTTTPTRSRGVQPDLQAPATS